MARLLGTMMLAAQCTDIKAAEAGKPARNLLENAGFEQQTLGPWVPSGAGASLITNPVYSGNRALHLDVGADVHQVVKGLTPGALYLIRGWLKSVQGKAEVTYAEVGRETNGNLQLNGYKQAKQINRKERKERKDRKS